MDLLIKNVTLVPMGGKNEVIENTNIYIEKDGLKNI